MSKFGIPKLVTPHVGVWIETVFREHYDRDVQVTPHVGVWIETYKKLI